MSLNSIFEIAGSAMTAESARLTTSAENLSNVNVEVTNPDDAYQPRYPIFEAVQEQAQQWMGDKVRGGVKLLGVYESTAEPFARYEPDNPISDANGFVYTPNMSYIKEMANVISASRAYQMNIELLNTTKQLMQRTLQLGE
ncbi:flagellar basal body rod protein FlgC [Legionella worsleiensis]|uniref:Flagellar basal-body rod protein FlgC n=1 Tax=Legionella worsleiensis TaxID=45076 RepID=A0A0W1A5X6_9GAMM|nr:flagellar basal body rod protein FlgC [Legionella worsleiensis]KTD76681.1 flagellar basal body rod protein FlgC [Legionella worsleiensis]STY30433.1 flagellar basal-body rod protein FlgC [Legionella worsleiensis]